ncbi:MAG: hypothetical protein Q7S02_03645 [bacterium]|nr:hypothetical protein [bacterium]
MAYSRGTRTRMIITTMLVLLLGGALIAWEAMRGRGASMGGQRAASARFDPATMQAVLEDLEKRALVPLAPPVVPKNLGNPTPFLVPEQRQ